MVTTASQSPRAPAARPVAGTGCRIVAGPTLGQRGEIVGRFVCRFTQRPYWRVHLDGEPPGWTHMIPLDHLEVHPWA